MESHPRAHLHSGVVWGSAPGEGSDVGIHKADNLHAGLLLQNASNSRYQCNCGFGLKQNHSSHHTQFRVKSLVHEQRQGHWLNLQDRIHINNKK